MQSSVLAAEIQNALRPLISWSEAGRVEVEKSMLQGGRHPLISVEVPTIKLKNPEGTDYSFSTSLRRINALAGPAGLRDLKQINWPDPQPLRDAAAEIHRLLGSGAEYWSPFQPEFPGLTRHRVDFSAEPVEWIFSCVVVPIFWAYLSNLTDLRQKESERLLKLIVDASDFLVSDEWRVQELVAVAGLVSDECFSNGDVTIRPATSEEMGEWFEPPRMIRTHKGVRRIQNLNTHVPTHILSFEYGCSKKSQPIFERRCHRVLLALQMLGFRPGSPGHMMLQVQPEWSSRGTTYTPLALPSVCKPKLFSAMNLAEANALAVKIPLGALCEPQDRIEIALQRFRTALEREAPVDVLLDSVIVLEAILLVGTESELAYRFALRGARWLAVDAEDRGRLFKELRDIYTLRSKLVHGAKFPKQTQIAEAADRAVDIAQQVLLKAVQQGLPTVAQFDHLALG